MACITLCITKRNTTLNINGMLLRSHNLYGMFHIMHH
uniref:Uncharacterized protein n=1 Tax=Arundo donax TaxID=35708 RepID=A0A0A9AZE7_ARUDO